MHAGPASFARRQEGRVVGGVAGGFADHHGLDAIVVRCALVLLTFAGGLGLVLYALGAVLSRAPGSGPDSGSPAPREHLRNASAAAITLGTLLVVRSTGLWLGDAFMAPLIAIVVGLAVLGVVRPDVGDRPWDAFGPSALSDLAAGRFAAARLIGGAVLVSLGLVLVGIGGGVSTSVRVGAFATALTIVGAAIVVGPWMARMVQEMTRERRQRIRVQEREAVAAHLHDSVLQTLALIQRTADDPRRTVTLARQQERALREWLYGTPGAAAETLTGAVRAMAREVEEAYDVRVEVVIVGDRPLDDQGAALTGAVREACVNAAKHSGEPAVSVYIEVGGTGVEAFVRDRGRGFEPGVERPDRRGIAQSIVARLERVGGRADVESSPGGGTEVHLLVPVEATASSGAPEGRRS